MPLQWELAVLAVRLIPAVVPMEAQVVLRLHLDIAQAAVLEPHRMLVKMVLRVQAAHLAASITSRAVMARMRLAIAV